MSEPEYLKGFRDWCRNPRVTIDFIPEAGVPLTLVKEAIARKEKDQKEARRAGDDDYPYDEIWCVFDRDAHPKFLEARNLAKAHELRQATSNPCFELWLLLHLRDSPGAQDRHKVQKMFAELHPEMPPKHVDFSLLSHGYPEAVRRAQRLENDALEAQEECRNPSTEVFHLTRSIDESSGGAARGTPGRAARESRQKAEAAKIAALEQAAAEVAQRDPLEQDEFTAGLPEDGE